MKQRKNISAALFGVLTLFQMLTLRYLVTNGAISSVPIAVLVEVAATCLLGVLAVQIFSHEGVLAPAYKKAVTAGALLYLLFQTVYYDTQIQIILYSVAQFDQGVLQQPMPAYLAFAAKVILLVAAVALAVISPKNPGEPSEIKEAIAEAAEAMDMSKEGMKKEVGSIVSEFSDDITSDGK